MFDQGLALSRASGIRSLPIGPYLGYAAALQGRLAEGRALLEEAIREDIRMGVWQNQALRFAWLSEVWRLAGRGAEAWQHACQALDRKRSGYENLTLAISSAHGVPCRYGHAPDLPIRPLGTDATRSARVYWNA